MDSIYSSILVRTTTMDSIYFVEGVLVSLYLTYVADRTIVVASGLVLVRLACKVNVV